MSDLEYTVRVMKREEAQQVLDLWKETTMNEGTLEAIHSWLEVDPEAIYVAVKESGEIIGALAAVIHHEDMAFFGLYVVDEKYHGKGVGTTLWKAGEDHIGSMNAVLNAVPGKLELYRDELNFPVEEERFDCVQYKTLNISEFHPEALSNILPQGVSIQPFQDSLLSSMIDYDQSVMGFRRDKALRFNSMEKNSKTMIAMKDGACVGWGTIKSNCYGYAWVGPLYADDGDLAEVIVKRLLTGFPLGKGFLIVTLTSNKAVNAIMDKIGRSNLEKKEYPLLYRKYKLNVDVNKIHAVFNCNFSPF